MFTFWFRCYFSSIVYLHSDFEFQLFVYISIWKSAVCSHSNCEYLLFDYIFIVNSAVYLHLNCEFQLFVYIWIWKSTAYLYINIFITNAILLKLKLFLPYSWHFLSLQILLSWTNEAASGLKTASTASKSTSSKILHQSTEKSKSHFEFREIEWPRWPRRPRRPNGG